MPRGDRLPDDLRFELDDLSRQPVRDLVARHLAGMHAQSPPESVHALALEGLRDPAIRFWSVWKGEDLAGMGALRRIDAGNGEIKSMRVADAFLGQGVGRAILDHILSEARGLGLAVLWLETGSVEGFIPARTLYASVGFTTCGPFDTYGPDPFSVFMTLRL
ncbi:GNAT family N-acetyltransferase [Phenylobacterium parvum]|uniref:GNAT family N-acetyltransferase n=2 Tax=Phenylobacterium parvum TaxID=2201350 RepID=A0A2Z3I089_9CAUL|nr:GNAT family N-acetyltransferase [Phenylobacterium parvum]